MDNEFDGMSGTDIQKALADWVKQSRPARPQRQDAPGTLPGESDKSRANAAELYGKALLRKEPGQLTRNEREWLRADIAAALAEDE